MRKSFSIFILNALDRLNIYTGAYRVRGMGVIPTTELAAIGIIPAPEQDLFIILHKPPLRGG